MSAPPPSVRGTYETLHHLFSTDIGNHFDVKTSLKDLDHAKLVDLGGALGLSHPKLKRMGIILDDMTTAWLNREDDVLSRSGEPTWKKLVDALEETGQRGIAEDIKKKWGKRDQTTMSIKSTYTAVVDNNL